MNVSDWQQRLDDTFSEGGVIGPRIYEVLQAERDHRLWATDEFRGHVVLMNSFESFAIDTLRLAERTYAMTSPTPPHKWYATFLLQQTIQLGRIRCTENLLLDGYPMVAYSLLRDVKDWAIFAAAVAAGLTTRRNLEGLGPFDESAELKDSDYELIHRSRVTEESRVLDQMLRKATDLDPAIRKELVAWERLFNSEVHGARLSFARHGSRWRRGEAPLPIGPTFNEDDLAAMYLNRAGEVSWMLLRTFPLLQLNPAAFGGSWPVKWEVLNDSFRFYVRALAKPVVDAVEAFVEARFSFSPTTDSYERCKE